MQAFYFYLKESYFRESTALEHVRNVERFALWAKENDFTHIERMTYTELLSYVQHLKQKGVTTSTINLRLCSLRKYYDHLKEEGYIDANPAKRLLIKGTMRKVVSSPLTYPELETLYRQYVQYQQERSIRDARQEITRSRSIVILGLMIWQGAHSGELQKMEVTHVNLEAGSVYLPSTARSNSRELQLSTHQVMPINTYLKSLPASQEKLFDYNMHNELTRISAELKGINPLVRGGRHIRASVILHWLKMYSKRQVQYMIGHKWIGSTENYRQQDTDTLTDLLAKHHPFG